MPSPASQSASVALLLLTTLGANVAAENVGIKAKVTNAVCSNGFVLNDYSIECLDDNGKETACGFGRSANINANGKFCCVLELAGPLAACHYYHNTLSTECIPHQLPFILSSTSRNSFLNISLLGK